MQKQIRTCTECSKDYTNPGTRCNTCRNKVWKKNNREKDLEQRRAYNKEGLIIKSIGKR